MGKIESVGPGYWVGVEMDDGLGDTNGSVGGEQLFECAGMSGLLIRPADIEVGDFPKNVEDEFDPDEDMIWKYTNVRKKIY